MKRIFTFFATAIMCSQLFAGGIVTNSNQSAHFVRLLSRNASTGIDAVYFNPAGLVRMDDGFHFSLNNQTVFQEKTVTNNFGTLNDNSYIGDVSAPLFPSFFAVYKKDKLALGFGFGPNGGGGSAEYSTGLPSFEMPISLIPGSLTSKGILTDKYSADIYFNGSSVFWGAQVNGSYAINDMISVSAGVRMVFAKNVYEGHLKNIQINPMHPLNANGMGNMVSAPLFFTDLATAASGASEQIQPLITNGAGGLTLDQAVAGIPTFTQEQADALAAGLGIPSNSLLTIAQIQGGYDQSAALSTENALKTADMDVDATQTGRGFTPFFGANITINDKLNIGIKYELNTKLELTNEADADKDANGMFKNDSTFRSDIPAILALGIEYKIMDEFRVSASWTHYFDKNADWNGKEAFVDKNLYEIALGMEYDVSEKITLSAGYMHGQTGVGQGYQTDLSFSNSTSTVGFGGRLHVNENLSIDLGALFTMYTDGNEDKVYNYYNTAGELKSINYKETYGKSLMDFAIGVNYKF
ncbi:MAG: outer membrane protein transport protein [Salinivirgaceae bacterium]|nr:outer membrane protein transport protein [Salinivirgaceae bacterium]